MAYAILDLASGDRIGHLDRDEPAKDCRRQLRPGTYLNVLPLHVQRFFAQMQSQRPSAEDRDVFDAASDPDALAASGHSQALRQDGHLTCPVIHLVETERDERQAPRAGDNAADADDPVTQRRQRGPESFG